MKTKALKTAIDLSMLSEDSRQLWDEIVPQGSIKSAGRMELLKQALLCRDRLTAIRTEIETGTAAKASLYPVRLIRLENELRREFTRMLIALSLEWRCNVDGR